MLHVLLKTRIHFYLCKYKNLQFEHESSVPISFKCAFMIAGRAGLLTQPMFPAWSLSTPEPSPAGWNPGQVAWAGAWGPLGWSQGGRWWPSHGHLARCAAAAWRSLAEHVLAFKHANSLAGFKAPNEVVVPGALSQEILEEVLVSGCVGLPGRGTDGLALLSHANLQVQRLHSCLQNHWGVTVQSTEMGNTVFSH